MIKAATSQHNSTDGEEQEVFDTKRLKELKRLIWQSVKRTNESGIRAGDLVQLLKDIKALQKGQEQTFADLLV